MYLSLSIPQAPLKITLCHQDLEGDIRAILVTKLRILFGCHHVLRKLFFKILFTSIFKHLFVCLPLCVILLHIQTDTPTTPRRTSGVPAHSVTVLDNH